jgi:hypothetical protein
MANGIDSRITRLLCPLAKARETNVKVFSPRQRFVEYYALASSVCCISELLFGQRMPHVSRTALRGKRPHFLIHWRLAISFQIGGLMGVKCLARPCKRAKVILVKKKPKNCLQTRNLPA